MRYEDVEEAVDHIWNSLNDSGGFTLTRPKQSQHSESMYISVETYNGARFIIRVSCHSCPPQYRDYYHYDTHPDLHEVNKLLLEILQKFKRPVPSSLKDWYAFLYNPPPPNRGRPNGRPIVLQRNAFHLKGGNIFRRKT